MSERDIFLEALDREDPAARAAYLDAACAGDPGRRARIEGLLRAHEAAGGFLRTPAPSAEETTEVGTPPVAGPAGATPGHATATDLEATADAGEVRPAHGRAIPRPLAEGPGTVIGPYTLRQAIGEGGMGVVFLAEQERPVRRKVALKVIRAGMDSDQVIARFEAERQALALMDHPNIAKVLDAGTTDTGRPYFVMELVQGLAITRYCDEARLTPRQRLELMLPVCQAVQHAHQKGVIHRDIKPSNVLVTEVDGRPVPKVIDFGIAKATDRALTERSLFTQFGAVVGTPEYMSPEQAGLGSLDVDTRSDVYALGVLLYELLTGTTPLDRERLRQAGFAEMLRLIREAEPPTPSSRLSGSREAIPTVSALRNTEPARLSRLLRGDLDWIVMKSLEKDRTRRYETASALAQDLKRHLEGDPVEAGPPSRAYRLRRLARKHRVALTTVGLVVALALAGAAGVSLALRRALRAEAASRAVAVWATVAERSARAERDRALAAERDARAQRDRAATESEISRAISDFLRRDLLAQAGLLRQMRDGRPDPDLKVRTLLDRAAARLPGPFADRPPIEAALRQTIGEAYQELGLWTEARPHLQRAIALRTGSGGEVPPELRPAQEITPVMLLQEGRQAEAIAAYERLYRSHVQSGGDADPNALRVAETIAALSPPAQAVAWLERVAAARRRLADPDERLLVGTLSRLGMARLMLGQHLPAELALREALAACVRTGERGWPLPQAKSLLGACLVAQGRLDEAEPWLWQGYDGLAARQASMPGVGPTFTQAAARHLIELYEARERRGTDPAVSASSAW